MADSPTQRTLRECRRRGWRAGVVEKWIPPRGNMAFGRRVDLFGCIDLIAVSPRAAGALGIQATSGSAVSARVKKAQVEAGAAVRDWLSAGNAFEVWGWAKRGGRGKRKLWTVRRVAFTLRAGVLRTVEVEEQV